jgi:tetratricopeptide (TPR) repeat protein
VRRITWRGVAATAACLALLGAGLERALTCWGPNYDSVHFNSDVPDFGVPPQDIIVWRWHRAPVRPGTVPTSYYSSYSLSSSDEEDGQAAEDRLVKRARRLEARHRYASAIGAYKVLLERRIGELAFWQDRIEVLTQCLRKGRPAQWGAYIGARNAYESDPACTERVRQRMAKIAADPKAGFLRAHALYTVAAIEYDGENRPAAKTGFVRCADAYPDSTRAESALIMAVRVLLEDRSGDKPVPADRTEARRLASRLIAKYPQSRFKADAIGWLGRADYLEGRYDKALTYYRRQLEAGGPRFHTYHSIGQVYQAKGRRAEAFATYLRAFDRTNKHMAGICLRQLQAEMKPKEAAETASMLERDPELVQPYIAFRLHLTDTNKGDLGNLVALGRRSVQLHPKTKFSAEILARLAEAAYLQGRYKDARDFAARSLRAKGEGRDLARFVYGGTSNRLRRYAEAAQEFRRLIRESPSSYLVGGARENLALACEKMGQQGEALDQYSRLGYDWDVAYMLDVRMNPKQIEGFVRAYPNHKLRKSATYALGLRYLRKGRFALAQEWLGRLDRRDRLKMAGLVRSHDEDYGFQFEDSKLYDPLRTASELSTLHRRYGAAKSPEYKARSLYALASYYYRKRNLLLYNPTLWKGERATVYEMYWSETAATKADDEAWSKHCYEHECFARARAYCLEILHRYPRSSVAAKAAYTAAVSGNRLAHLNSWWRDEDDRIDLLGQSVRLMKRIVKSYPRSSLAKSAKKYGGVYAAEIAEGREYRWSYRQEQSGP